MIVSKKSDNPAFGGKEYSHIECDVPDCIAVSPTAAELSKQSLSERGWFISNGKHRCQKHFHDDVESPGPIVRAKDGSEGFVR